MLRRLSRSFVLVAFIVATPALVLAGPARDFVQEKQDALTGYLKAAGDNSSKITGVFDELLDYDDLAKRSLGKEWETLSTSEQKQFKELLEALVKKAYRTNLEDTLDYQVVIKDERPVEEEGEGPHFVVKTVATHRTDKQQAPVNVDYKLHRVGTNWKIFDIVTEGSSLVRTYRSQFGRVIRKNGFPKLLELMKKKVDKPSTKKK